MKHKLHVSNQTCLVTKCQLVPNMMKFQINFLNKVSEQHPNLLLKKKKKNLNQLISTTWISNGE